MRAILVAALLFMAACRTAVPAVDLQDYGEIARGRYLATVADCAACHTAPGGKPYAGGRAIETPFGTLLAPNLTPDRATGIGAWSDDEFAAALLDGKGAGGAHLYPAMPYTYYTRMGRADALAIRAFLATLEPVKNDVRSNQLPFPFNIRAGMILWDALYFTPGRFKPVAGKSAQWNRGAYLVTGPAHCGMCHTPKNFLGGDKTSAALQGGVLQGWLAPDVEGDPRRGLANWTTADVVTYLRSGHNRFTAATGPMSEVITDTTSQMTDADLEAIAVFLKGERSTDTPAPPPAPDDKTMHAGGAIYVDECAACHAGNGAGISGLFPTLRGNAMVQQSDATDLIRIVLAGAKSVSTDRAPTGPAMPSFAWKLDDGEVAAVLSYIRRSWGNAAAPVSAGDVAALRQQVARGGE